MEVGHELADVALGICAVTHRLVLGAVERAQLVSLKLTDEIEEVGGELVITELTPQECEQVCEIAFAKREINPERSF